MILLLLVRELTICRQRISCGLQDVEVVFSLAVSPKFASKVVVDLVLGVLEIVFPIGRCFPDIDYDVRDWLLGVEVDHGAVHQAGLSVVGRHDYRVAEVAEGSIGGPEGA